MTRPDLAQKRGELREVIRDAAIAEFAELGQHGASTQGIADRAGISKNKLHYYIDSKEELYQDALEHIISIWADLFDGIALDQGPNAFLSDYIARKVGFSLDHPAEVKMFTGEVMRGAPMLRDHWAGSREATRRAASRIVSWVADGVIRPVDPMMLLFHIWAMTEAYAVLGAEVRFMLDLGGDTPLDRAAITAEITGLVLNSLRP
ncbi:MAG: TetR family transcriptional regulator C-terminal domain-containing protein [Paracoccaceae bacterium]|nr:TetR family transcriptional regulator C-terminal domain-containing protein [Paracoccaceae bacterium]